MHLLGIIREKLDQLPPSEARVGAWLLENLRQASSLTIAEVATATAVSEPTVIRFCRSLDISGFRDLRTQMISALHEPETFVHRDVVTTDSYTVATGKVVDSCVRALMEISRQIADLPLATAVPMIAGARQIVFCGLGASGHVAQDAQHKFFRIGIPCSTALDEPTIMQSSAIADPRDVFIFISHTGSWPTLIEGAGTVSARGAKVITLTDPKSPLAARADVSLACRATEDTSAFTPMSSRLAHLALLDGIQVAVALHLGAEAETRLRLSKASLNLMREREVMNRQQDNLL